MPLPASLFPDTNLAVCTDELSKTAEYVERATTRLLLAAESGNVYGQDTIDRVTAAEKHLGKIIISLRIADGQVKKAIEHIPAAQAQPKADIDHSHIMVTELMSLTRRDGLRLTRQEMMRRIRRSLEAQHKDAAHITADTLNQTARALQTAGLVRIDKNKKSKGLVMTMNQDIIHEVQQMRDDDPR